MNPRISKEKATLCHLINELCRKPPPEVINGSIQTVRLWRAKQTKARLMCANTRASTHDLTLAYESMLHWRGE